MLINLCRSSKLVELYIEITACSLYCLCSLWLLLSSWRRLKKKSSVTQKRVWVSWSSWISLVTRFSCRISVGAYPVPLESQTELGNATWSGAATLLEPCFWKSAVSQCKRGSPECFCQPPALGTSWSLGLCWYFHLKVSWYLSLTQGVGIE